MVGSLILKAGREKSLLKRHPWVFSGAVASLQGEAPMGGTVAIRDYQGKFLAWGSYNAQSQIVSRVWSWDEAEKIDSDFFARQLTTAIKRREAFQREHGQDGLRLVYGESDGIPGLIVDQYADVVVVQFLAAGVDYWREAICDLLLDVLKPASLFERSDVDVRKLEGLPLRTGVLRGSEPPELVLIRESDLEFWVDVRQGHKTGFYLDQRFNRLKVREIARDKEVLDCFCYSGGFGVNAAAGGAKSVLSLDASADALRLAQANYTVNRLADFFNPLEGDAFELLRRFRDSDRHFDLIVMDPPKFAKSAAMVEKAARGYKDINLLALKLLKPGGYLVTFSCSGGVSEELFQKILAGAALDAGVNAQIIERLHQAGDHPVSLYFPEGAYLKGFIIRVE